MKNKTYSNAYHKARGEAERMGHPIEMAMKLGREAGQRARLMM